MENNTVAATGYAISALAYAIAAVMFLVRWQAGRYSRPLGAGCLALAIWSAVSGLHGLSVVPFTPTLVVDEWIVRTAWVASLFAVVRSFNNGRQIDRFAVRIGIPYIVVVTVGLLLYSGLSTESLASAFFVTAGVVTALVTLGIVDQLYRNLPADSQTGMQYLCVALFVVSLFDMVAFTHAITAGGLAPDLWSARGYVHAMVAVPLLLVGVRTKSNNTSEISEHVQLHSFFVLFATALIAGVLAADLYVKSAGGAWSDVATMVLAVFVVTLIGTLLVSSTTRARVRVYLTKAFFRYKYDYRKEWLRFIGTLSESGPENVPATSIRAVAQIVNSPGGIVWTRSDEDDRYLPVGAWRSDLSAGPALDNDSSLVKFLRKNQWVIDLNEMKTYPSRYDGLHLDTWFEAQRKLWLVVPMLVGRRLYGFIALLRPRVAPALNFEDHDLLRTVGRHAGSHIKQAESDKRLAESSQFGTYHRLSAFLMHDLNNLIAQQSLVVKNAERFRHEPKFVDDTIDTIAHSVSRMRRLMEQLSSVTQTPNSTRVSLRDVLEGAVRNSATRMPLPVLEFADTDIGVKADPDRLTVVIEHLVRNAQDATDENGTIRIAASVEDGTANIVISDTGCGMSPEFIGRRLFRPFDSTKGSQSMGIGAYQAREYVRMLGGKLEVESRTGEGSTFHLRIPVADL